MRKPQIVVYIFVHPNGLVADKTLFKIQGVVDTTLLMIFWFMIDVGAPVSVDPFSSGMTLT